MKEAALLVLIAVVIVGGVGIWLANGNTISLFSSPPSNVQSATDLQATKAEADASKKEAEAKLLKKAVRPAKKVTLAEDAPEAALPVAEIVVVPVPPPPAPKQFPSANEISVGAQRENIAEKFGQPALLTTTTSNDGRVMETLVYARRSGRDVTVIRVEDGKVLSAYTR